MEIKTEAVVLQSLDYKDNDKILTLFSPTLGKITAGIKGVKKPTAVFGWRPVGVIHVSALSG